MCSGRTPSMPPANSEGNTVGPSVPAMTAPPGPALQPQQVHRRRADEAGDEYVGRRFVQLDRRAVLLDAPAVQQDHPIGHRHRLDLIVRHVDHRDAELALQCADLLAHFGAQLRVEVRQRLVHQAHRRLVDDRAAQRHALLLSARQLRRLARRAAPSGPSNSATRASRDAHSSAVVPRARAGRTGCFRRPKDAGTTRSSGTPSRCCAAPAAVSSRRGRRS